MITPGSWPLPSPLLPPTPLTATLPPISPLTSFNANNRGYLTPSAHFPYTSSGCGTAPAPGLTAPLSAHGNCTPGYFQWPTASRHAPHVTTSHDSYEHFPSSGPSLFMCPSAPSQPPNNAPSNLPDFDTVFTSTLGAHTSHS